MALKFFFKFSSERTFQGSPKKFQGKNGFSDKTQCSDVRKLLFIGRTENGNRSLPENFRIHAMIAQKGAKT